MGIINWLYNQDSTIVNGEKSASYGPADDYWYTDVSGGSLSGASVTPDSAMRASAVQACVRVLAETIAQLPLKVYERMPDGGKQEASNHPLWDVLHSRPNSWQTSFEWREMMMGHIALRGNGYSEIRPGPRGFADTLIPLHPDRVKVQQLDNKNLVYEFTDEKGRRQTLGQDRVLHIRLLSSDGIIGQSPITMAREAIGLSLATESYGARFFKNNARPGGVITAPNGLNEEARENLKRSWNQAHTGENNHKVAVLEQGMKWEQIGMTSEDAQFLETRKYQVNEIARVFRVPPHMIGDLEKATFSNIEQQSLEFVLYTMMPHAVRWEQGMERDLILNPQRFFIRFNFDGLLRGDIKTRYEAYNSAITNGWLTRNEARKREDMNPLPGLDEPLEQMNMTPAGSQGPGEPKAKLPTEGLDLRSLEDAEYSNGNKKGAEIVV